MKVARINLQREKEAGLEVVALKMAAAKGSQAPETTSRLYIRYPIHITSILR